MPRLYQLLAHAQMIRVKGDRELGKKGHVPRTRMLDQTLATENELDREYSNREQVRLKRARYGSDEGTDQYVTLALSVRSSLLLATKLIYKSIAK